jgi:hypothetical protein
MIEENLTYCLSLGKYLRGIGPISISLKIEVMRGLCINNLISLKVGGVEKETSSFVIKKEFNSA